METKLLQVVSSFTSIPVAKSLRPHIQNAGIADDLAFAQYGQMTEYMLGSGLDSGPIVGTIILLRVEDWLREDAKSSSAFPTSEGVRQKLRMRVDEFATHLASLSRRGKPIWFLPCPSTGWIADKFKLEVLCRTHTSLLVARVKDQVTMLKWPPALLSTESNDRGADRLGQIPFTADAFRQLGDSIGQQVASAAPHKSKSEESPADSSGSPELANYLAGLQVHVRVTSVQDRDRTHVDRLLRTAAAFSLTGERPDMPDAEVEALLNPDRCLLVSVSDRLSDYGPSGVIAYRAIGDSLVVNALALSCPVLGKQVEFAVILALARLAAGRQLAKVVFEYRPSGRNQAMLAFLRALGDEQSGSQYVVPVSLAEPRIKQAAIAPGAWTLELPELPRSLPHLNGQ